MKLAIAIAAFTTAAAFASCRTQDTNDADVVRSGGAAQDVKDATIDSLKMEIAKQRVIDSMQEVARLEQESALEEQAAATAAASRSTSSTRRASSSSAYSNNSYAGSSNSTASQPVYTEPEKRGMSAKAKGAIIGAGTGAVTGAIINKRNRSKGAIVGGVLGAGAGTGVGAIIDKKNGR